VSRKMHINDQTRRSLLQSQVEPRCGQEQRSEVLEMDVVDDDDEV